MTGPDQPAAPAGMDAGPAEPPRFPPARPAAPRGWRRIPWAFGWPFRQLLAGLIRFYRRFISPALPDSCRYHPSCSAYAMRSIEVHGALKGLALGSWRLLRCNPWSKGGWDPVPPRGRWVPPVHPDGRLRYPHPGYPPHRSEPAKTAEGPEDPRVT